MARKYIFTLQKTVSNLNLFKNGAKIQIVFRMLLVKLTFMLIEKWCETNSNIFRKQ
jgi:hypothetical protein